MTKKTPISAAKRRQKNAQKSKTRDKKVAARKASQKTDPKDMPEEKYLFWLAHGVNCILSDKPTASWEPLYPEIYEGAVFPATKIAEIFMSRYEAVKDWSTDIKSALGWLVSNPSVVNIYYHEALRRARSNKPLETDLDAYLQKPGCPEVWEVFEHLKIRTLRKK